MGSVGSPSIARIMSPIHRLAWAALLPGVTYNTGDMINDRTTQLFVGCMGAGILNPGTATITQMIGQQKIIAPTFLIIDK